MTPTPTPVPSAAASALDLLDRSRHSLLEACHTRDIVQRHRQAQLAALRAAAAVVAARTRPGGPAGPRSLWELVPSVAPELAEWAGFFELVAARPGPHTAREADDLLRQSETFLELVCRALGLPVASVDRDVLVPTVAASAASGVPVRGGGSP
ncbi:MAG TPA: SAV_6107 family HEPN domain-containing protein [Pedococcus sp.]|nr:SAV_6107 family HEPN domain-containing protein [Pedococcus sp.]